MAKRWPVAVDLFSGCGAVTQALKNRHFNVVAAVENDQIAVKTYEANHPTVNLYKQDIQDVSPKTILDNDLADRELDLLVVCAPCQPFSSQTNYDGSSPKRELILEAIRFTRVLSPKVVFFENVPGFKTERFRPLLNRLRDRLAGENYQLGDPIKVNAADYGVPQRRERCVMIAQKGSADFPCIPEPTTPEGSRVTIHDQIGHLENLSSGEYSTSDDLHHARDHHEKTLRRIKHVSEGGDRLEIPKELWLECHKDYDGHLDVLGRMNGDGLAPTLTRGCTDVYKGKFTHPVDDRAITPREAALLQTFPEDYIFHGNYQEISSQIGNAVPVKLIEELTPMIREKL